MSSLSINDSDQRLRGRAQAAEELARLTFASISDYAIFSLDIEGNVRSWNPGAERINGYTTDEILGRHFSIFFLEEDLQAGRTTVELERAAKDGRYEDEGWRLRKDGSRFWANAVISAMRDDSGELIGFVTVTRDLSDRRETELALRASEERFRILVSSVRDYAIFMLNPDGTVATWNLGAEQIKGYSPNEIIGQHISRFYTEEDRAAGRPQRLLNEAIRSGRVEDEGWRVRKDGTRFWADVVITAMRDAHGKLIGFGKVTRDLTDRRQAEEQVRLSEERFRLLVTSVRDYAIYLLDPKGHIMAWNTGAERIKGYSADEIIGQHFRRFYPPEDIAAGKPELELELAEAHGRFEEEGWRIRKDGSRFWANVVLTPVRDSNGMLVGFAKVTRDLTERRSADEERLRLAHAQEAIRLRDEFLSIASHELKTPLTAMRLQLQSLADLLAEQERLQPKINRAVKSTERLGALVETLLDVSRISAGRFRITPEPFSLEELATEVVERLREPAKNSGNKLRVKAEGDLRGTWDRLRLEQVINNLLSNAIRYAAGTPVDLDLSREGDEVLIRVSDRGPGISEKDQARIFERFERAASMRHYGGLGLGLYVTRQIVEAHGGTASVANRPGGGATFTIRLPMHTVPTHSAEPEDA